MTNNEKKAAEELGRIRTGNSGECIQKPTIQYLSNPIGVLGGLGVNPHSWNFELWKEDYLPISTSVDPILTLSASETYLTCR